MRKLGLLLSSEAVDRRDEAMDVWRTLLEGGDDIEALRTLAVWDEEKENWSDLAGNLRRQANLAGEPGEKAGILRRLADVLYEKLGEPRKAVEVLSEVLDVLPEDRSTLTILRVIHADVEDYRQAAETLERELRLAMEPDEEKALLVQLATWYQEKLEDHPRAIASFERILALEPGDFQALSALDELYEKEGEWEKLLRLIRSKTKAEEDEAERLGLLLRGARICEEKLEDGSRAWSWYREIFSRITVDEDVMSVIEEAAHRLEQWGDLATMYEDLAPRAADADGQVKRWRQAAELYFDKLDDSTRALYVINHAVIADPDSVELLEDADRAALGCKDWERLATIYERISRGIDDMEGRVMLLKRFAGVVWRKGGFARGAVMPLLRAVEEMPGDAELFEEFHEAALEAGEYMELLGAFDKRFRASTDDEERIEIKLRMARIMAEHLNNIDGAIKIIQDAIEVDPASEKFGKLIFDAARGVENNLAERDRGYVYSWLLKTYQAHADSYEASDPVRVQFLRQIARLYREGLGDVPSAFNAYRDAHRLTPSDLVLLERLEALAEQENYWEALADHYAGVLRLSLKMEAAEIVHDRRARILAEELSRPDEAAEHYWQLIQMNPDHPTAFRKLSEFYRSVGRYNDLLVILENAIERTEDDEQRIALLRETARVWDQDLSNRFEALDAYKKILADHPDDGEALEAVDRLSKAKLGLAARLGGEEEEEEEEVDVEELRRTLLEEDLSDIKAPSKPPPPPEEKDELPDWEDAVDTGEVPLQKVSQLLAMSREPDEAGAEVEEGQAQEDAGEPPVPVNEQAAEPEPVPEEEAPSSVPEPPAQAGEPPEPADGIESLENDGDTPPEQAPPAEEGGAEYVLDDDSLSDMLEEEYAVDEFPAGEPRSSISEPPPLPPGAKRSGDGDSLPPPPPPVRKRGQALTPPPRPPRKKRR
jgi:tetratricopeptide (TPR) repeat protein